MNRVFWLLSFIYMFVSPNNASANTDENDPRKWGIVQVEITSDAKNETQYSSYYNETRVLSSWKMENLRITGNGVDIDPKNWQQLKANYYGGSLHPGSYTLSWDAHLCSHDNDGNRVCNPGRVDHKSVSFNVKVNQLSHLIIDLFGGKVQYKKISK
jgi:hypothetical protein